MLINALRLFFVTIVSVGLAGPVLAQTVGSAIRVTPGATVERAGQVVTLQAGQSVASGDVIETDRRGQVQLLFEDETRIAIGPNSSFVIDDVRLKQNGKARKFVVSAVAGGFRFLSGTSARSAYKIDTPTATMGIRGTAFDFVVRKAKGTDLMLFSGRVNMCGSGGCYQVQGGCDAVRLDARGNFARFEKRPEKRSLVGDGFVFVTGQQKLRPDFRTNVRSCGRDVISRPVSKAGDRTPPARPDPPKAPTGPEPY